MLERVGLNFYGIRMRESENNRHLISFGKRFKVLFHTYTLSFKKSVYLGVAKIV